ncbi:MAG TPA: hypothetical protein VLX92_29095 [Kofleriaceae bacterium]|nr:hypothetical protein [Kofleriaceae bacterium]
MSEPNVLVNFRLDKDRPLRLRWMATDGVPGDGYKAQVTAIKLDSGARLAMDGSAILEQTAPDPAGGLGAYLVTFNGMVGYAADHPDRAQVEQIGDQEIDYDLELVHDDTGRVAVEHEDFEITERPRGWAHKLTRRGP